MNFFGKNRMRGNPDPVTVPDLDDISVLGDRKEFYRADTEVKEVVSRATQTDIRNILLIDMGRCPQCHGRTESFLYTVVCPSCGWFRREVPSRGSSIVTMKSGQTISCDYIHHSNRNEILCIRDGVVIAEIMVDELSKIDHVWETNELDEARILQHRVKTGICAWCERSIAETEPEGHGIDYVAFGAMQERYLFCTEKCQRAFRKHFPARVHRNCYEVDCNVCSLCIKRFDTRGFKRQVFTT